MTDILSYLLPDPTWALDYHLQTSAGLPLYTLLGIGVVWNIKGLAGYPWDSFPFDDNYVYQSVTENSWTDPTTLKKFASTSPLAHDGAILWMPREFNEGGSNAPLLTTDSTYRTYSNCTEFTTENLGAPILTTVDGPYTINFGGSLGKQSAIVQRYFWGPGLANMEVNYYAKGYGRCQWELWVLGANGLYTMTQRSAYNQIVSGGRPLLDFPCSALL